MIKMQKLSDLTPTLGFSEFDFVLVIVLVFLPMSWDNFDLRSLFHPWLHHWGCVTILLAAPTISVQQGDCL